MQSDERFAEAFLRSRIDKGKGPNIILSELLQRGVDELLVSNVLESISEGQWCEVAYETMNKKLGNESELDYDKQLKLMKFLNNRGFTRSQIERAKNLLSEKRLQNQMKTNEIRQAFIKFFESEGHQSVKSSPLIPANDPTLFLQTLEWFSSRTFF
ncbi:MAG: hypothetical protein Ct9H90mP13_13850 [Pseudomonadota bacterium]|nr:MAG: hypothetical protein Ct9H90mP13_13850 [Pseudomonadota bacterium]